MSGDLALLMAVNTLLIAPIYFVLFRIDRDVNNISNGVHSHDSDIAVLKSQMNTLAEDT